MELKYRWHCEWREGYGCLNRTFMELKFDECVLEDMAHRRLNRTFMELKYAYENKNCAMVWS